MPRSPVLERESCAPRCCAPRRRRWAGLALLAGGLGGCCLMGLADPASADAWVYRSLDLDPAAVQTAALSQEAYNRQQAGDLTRLRFGHNAEVTRLVLDFDSRTRFVVAPVSDRIFEITLLKLDPAQVGQNLAPAAGLIENYRFEPDGQGNTKLLVSARLPIDISVMGDLAPDETLEHYRVFFDFVEEGRQFPDPSFVKGIIDLDEGAQQAQAQPAPQPAQPPASDQIASDSDSYRSDSVDPREDGFYLRAAGSYAWTANTRDDIATRSDDAGEGYGLAGAVGYRVMPFLRAELEGGAFDGFEAEGAAGTADISGAFAALNAYVTLAPEAWRLRPYIGAGLGVAYNEVDDISGGTAAPAPGDEAYSLLWQFFAGAELAVIDHLSADIGYRYADRGDITSSRASDGAVYNGQLRAHEVYLGLIYDF